MKYLIKLFNKIFYLFFDLLFRSYQLFISPLLPARCRYYPTCSEYGRQALAWHGPWQGGQLTFARICRCHPWGGHGIDFVPVPLYRHTFIYITDDSQLPLAYKHYVFIDRTGYPALLNYLLSAKNKIMPAS